MARQTAAHGDLPTPPSPLRIARLKRGFSLDYVAARVTAAGVTTSVSLLSRIETGERGMTDRRRKALAEIYGVDPDSPELRVEWEDGAA